MKSADIVIIGGGMVGLALARLLEQAVCSIKIIEKTDPTPWLCPAADCADF